MDPLVLAYSPCPNDTFIFHAWVKGLLPSAPEVREELHDIDDLNRLALEGKADLIKLSFPALAHALDDYALLHCGGALGHGAGPLVVAPAVSALATLRGEELRQALPLARVAIPGQLTTAALLFDLYSGGITDTAVLRYDRIMPAVAAGEVEAGVIIHESRFTYPLYGLHCLVDLGAWWEAETGYPVPLGAVAVRRRLGPELAAVAEAAICASLRRGRESPEEAQAYIREHAQEMDAEVCREHIDLYVTAFSENYGSEGEAAIRHLLEMARRQGAAPESSAPLFWDE